MFRILSFNVQSLKCNIILYMLFTSWEVSVASMYINYFITRLYYYHSIKPRKIIFWAFASDIKELFSQIELLQLTMIKLLLSVTLICLKARLRLLNLARTVQYGGCFVTDHGLRHITTNPTRRAQSTCWDCPLTVYVRPGA